MLLIIIIYASYIGKEIKKQSSNLRFLQAYSFMLPFHLTEVTR